MMNVSSLVVCLLLLLPSLSIAQDVTRSQEEVEILIQQWLTIEADSTMSEKLICTSRMLVLRVAVPWRAHR